MDEDIDFPFFTNFKVDMVGFVNLHKVNVRKIAF